MQVSRQQLAEVDPLDVFSAPGWQKVTLSAAVFALVTIVLASVLEGRVPLHLPIASLFACVAGLVVYRVAPSDRIGFHPDGLIVNQTFVRWRAVTAVQETRRERRNRVGELIAVRYSHWVHWTIDGVAGRTFVPSIDESTVIREEIARRIPIDAFHASAFADWIDRPDLFEEDAAGRRAEARAPPVARKDCE
jgi:hypothetical protein